MARKKRESSQGDPSIPATREEGSNAVRSLGNQSYEEAPPGPGLVGGPATESIPKSRKNPVEKESDESNNRAGPAKASKENDGGEAALSGQPRETGGDRPK